MLVTLIYLAVQVHHTRVQQDAQALSAAFQASFSAGEVLFYDGNMRVLQAGIEDTNAVSDEDQALFGLMMARQLGAVVMLNRSVDPVARAQLGAYKTFFDLPGAQAWFKNFPQSALKELSREAFDAVANEQSHAGVMVSARGE